VKAKIFGVASRLRQWSKKPAQVRCALALISQSWRECQGTSLSALGGEDASGWLKSAVVERFFDRGGFIKAVAFTKDEAICQIT
jgi:hypothetical protein